MAGGPLQRYREMVAAGEITSDPAQAAVLQRLQVLWLRLRDGQRDRTQKRRGLFGFGRKKRAEEDDQRRNGVYIYGGVGRGKSMLMDLFFEEATVAPKRRAHFHDFMQSVHTELRNERAKGHPDPLPAIARRIAKGAKLLCFDEMQVTDITDAMLLGRLYQGLLTEDIVIVATSNRVPDDLYKNGLNRALFVPFIELIKERLDVIELESATDHRLAGVVRGGAWFSPLGPETAQEIEALWRSVSAGAQIGPLTLTVQGHDVDVPAAAGRAARIGFGDLCGRALGAADYLALARRFDTVIIENVPVLSPEMRDRAKRFVTAIDAFYEAKTRVMISAQAEPQDLYPSGDGSFEFERTASRLIEMRSAAYLEKAGSGNGNG